MQEALVLDIETVPDAGMARAVLDNADAGDDVALSAVAHGEDGGLLKPLYHRVVAIATARIGRAGGEFSFRSDAGADEREMLERFWKAFSANPPVQVVTWNGRRFDLPVLEQRSFFHGLDLRTWFMSKDFRNRYAGRHLDLMDFLSGYGAAVALQQNEAAAVFRVPGKLGVQGDHVKTLWTLGRLEDIRAYCACDVLTLTLIYARLGVQAGWLTGVAAAAVESGVAQAAMAFGHPLTDAFFWKLDELAGRKAGTGVQDRKGA